MADVSIQKPVTKSDTFLKWTNLSLVTIVWISALIFGIYILIFYIVDSFDGVFENWNLILPDLYQEDEPVATASIGLHFAAGGIILILGSIQLVESIRLRYPVVHRWIGKIYVLASILTAIGGLSFIFISGTVGGVVMDIGFGLYGILTFVAGVETFRHAREKRFEMHKAWSWRLYALAIGSWLYRMDYGFWFILADGAGTTPDFRGVFDQVMAFFFYVPNLIVVEMLLRAQGRKASSSIKIGAGVLMLFATVFLVIGTYFFTKELWGPVILGNVG